MSDQSSDEMIPFDEEAMYHVEAIKDKRISQGRVFYHVKWLHWDKPQDMTWEPIQNLTTVKEMIQKFEKDRKGSSSQNKKSESKKHDDSESPKKMVMIKQKHLVKVSNKNREKEKEEKEQRQKLKQKKSIRKKEEKAIMISQSSSEESQQQKEQKQQRPKKKVKGVEEKYGSINHLFLIEKIPMYEIDVVNNQGDCIGVRLLKEQEIIGKKLQEKASIFLENRIIDDLRWKGI